MAESYRDEIAKLESMYVANPEGRVFTHLAEAYRKAGELVRAREVLEDGLRRHTDSASGYVVFGRVLQDLGQPREAASAFDRVLELDPENRVALRALGELARARGDRDQALALFGQLRALDPSDESVEVLIAELKAGDVVLPEAVPASPAFGMPAGHDGQERWLEATSPAGAPAAAADVGTLDLDAARGDADAPPPAVLDIGGLSVGGDQTPEQVVSAAPEAPPELAAQAAGLGWPGAEGGESVAWPGSADGGVTLPSLEGLQTSGSDAVDAAADLPVLPLLEHAGPELTEEATPEPGTSEAPPEPVAFEAAPERAESEAPSEPVAFEAAPEPTPFEAAPEPTPFEAAPEPVTSEAPPEPTAFEAAPEPATDGAPPEPLALEVAPEPAPFEAAPEAISSEAPPEPMPVDGAPAPAVEAVPEPAALEAAAFEAPPEPVAFEAPAEPVAFRAPEWDVAAPDEVVTETMAELYRAQGHPDRAAAVYRALLRERPGDEVLERKLLEVELAILSPAAGTVAAGGLGAPMVKPADEAGPDGDARRGETAEAGPAAAMEAVWGNGGEVASHEPTPYAWESLAAEEELGPPISAYLRGLLAWRRTSPAGMAAIPEPPASAPEASAPAQPEDVALAADPWAMPAPAPEPTWADDARGEPWAAPAEAAPAGDLGWLASPDGVPPEAPAPPQETPPGGEGAQAAAEAPGDDDDLEMFRAWLQSLKK